MESPKASRSNPNLRKAVPDIYLLINGEQQGPYTEEKVRESLAEGLIPTDLPAWREGMEDWLSLDQFLHLGVANAQPLTPVEPGAEVPLTGRGVKRNVMRRLLVGIGILVGTVTVVVTITLLVGFRVASQRLTDNKATPLTERATVKLSTAAPAALSTSASNPVLPPPVKAIDHPASPPSVDDTKKWLKDKIEAFGGDSYRDIPTGMYAKITYRNLYFYGDVLTIEVVIDNINGGVNNVEKIDLSAIKKDSFKFTADDRSWDKRTTYENLVVYKIGWSALDGESPTSTANGGDFYSIKIKDEAMAKRIVDALNFLTEQSKPEPF